MTGGKVMSRVTSAPVNNMCQDKGATLEEKQTNQQARIWVIHTFWTPVIHKRKEKARRLLEAQTDG